MSCIRYFTVNACVSCNKALEFWEAGHSNGTCPYCGHTNDSTFCKTKKVKYKTVKTKHPNTGFFKWLSPVVEVWSEPELCEEKS